MSWTPVDDITIINMRKLGTPYQTIANHIDRTKNAVISRARRLGVPVDRNHQSRRSKKPPPKAKLPKVEQALPKVPTSDIKERSPYTTPVAIGVVNAVLALNGNNCRYPVGNVFDSNFHFCMLPTIDKRRYCKQHFDKCVDVRRSSVNSGTKVYRSAPR